MQSKINNKTNKTNVTNNRKMNEKKFPDYNSYDDITDSNYEQIIRN